MRPATRLLCFTALALGLGACGSETGPSANADVRGTWTGSFGSTSVRMVLSQSGGDVTGEITASSQSYPLTGAIDRTTGVFTWSSQRDQASCIAWSGNSMQLSEQGTKLSGSARRTQTSSPCGTGRTSVTGGIMTLSRAF